MSKNGRVYLVGAGPGDPGLLTVKASDLIQKCDVIIYDRLVGSKIIREVPATTEMIYVGKESNRHALPQDDINLLLVEKAKEGKMVVRLKGGDPFYSGEAEKKLSF